MNTQQLINDTDTQACNPDRYIVTSLIRLHKNMIGNGEGGHKTQRQGCAALGRI